MRRTWCIVALAAAALPPNPSKAQPLVPLDDPVHEPLLPTGISLQDVDLSGTLAYLWQAPDGTHVVHLIGDFELSKGQQRMTAREAVVWMTVQTHQDVRYQHMEIFLWQDVEITEPAGTTTQAPLMMITLNTRGRVQTHAGRVTHESSADTSVYQEAIRVRARLAEAGPATGKAGPTDRFIAATVEEPSPRRSVYFRAPRETTIGEIDGQPIVTVVGGVYLFQSDPDGGDLLELRADSAVIFLEPGRAAAESLEEIPPPGDLGASGGGARLRADSSAAGDAGGFVGGEDVQGVYLEGDVLLARGERFVRASRLYYDFASDRALILDAVLHTVAPERNLPIYVRAEKIRLLSATHYVAQDVRVTTSEFYTPHYHVGAERIEVEDLGSVRAGATSPAFQAGRFTLTHTTLNFSNVPVFYWPYATGDFRTGETALRSIRTGYSDRFGTEVETRWRLFNLLGVPTPTGFDASLRLDYFSDRGPAAGLDLDYETDTYTGLFRGYYLRDRGKDRLARFLDNEPDTKNRSRTTWRHRHYLPDDWQLTLELSYITDPGFLEEFFEREFDVGKDQETLFYLKRQTDNWAFTAHAQWRLLDFYTQTERLPEFSFRLIGDSLGGRATLFSENRAGWIRFRPGEQTFFEKLRLGANPDGSGAVGRADTRQEIDVPFTVGPIKIVPFIAARGTVWDDSPGDGGLTRVMGTYGLRGSMYLTRTFDKVESELFDIHGLRHIIKPDVTAWVSHTNVDSDQLFPFDEGVEGVDEVDGVTVGVRQRWQTRRGSPDRLRTVDLFTLDVEFGAFNDSPGKDVTNGFASFGRVENSIARNYVRSSTVWRINDATALVSEANFDLTDGELDIFNISYSVERDPRFSYLFAYRFIDQIDSNLLGFGANYRISEKHSIAIREQFDLDRGRTLDFAVGYVRKFPRWFVSITLDLDEVDDDIGVSVSAWPEGLPSAAVGSRRFTGLATSVGIRPD